MREQISVLAEWNCFAQVEHDGIGLWQPVGVLTLMLVAELLTSFGGSFADQRAVVGFSPKSGSPVMMLSSSETRCSNPACANIMWTNARVNGTRSG